MRRLTTRGAEGLRWLAKPVAQAARGLVPATVPVPTARTVAVLVLAAPIALVIAALAPGAWLVAPALGVAVLMLVLADVRMAGSLNELVLSVPTTLEVGQTGHISIRARISKATAGGRPAQVALSLDRRVAEGGVARFVMHRDTSDANQELFSATLAVTPSRRGTCLVDGVSLRWEGPLGLGARLHRRDENATVRVTPSIAPLRAPAMQAYLRDAELGLVSRRRRGEGTEIEALGEYQPGMDRRRIDWKVSARHRALRAREYEAERNNHIVFAVDCGQAMCQPLAGETRLDRAITCALTTAWVALKGGDKVALFGFGARVRLATPFAEGTRGFNSLQQAAATLDYEPREPNFTLALASLATRLARRALIVVFSDFSDPTSAALMVESVGRLVARHRVLFVSFVDEELAEMATATPDRPLALAMAVAAGTLQTQRAEVLARLRRIGVEVIETRHGDVGTRVIDRYLLLRQRGEIG